MAQEKYLGDGVYATFDGYHVNLHLYDHKSPRVVALEPEVQKALIGYINHVNMPGQDEIHIPPQHNLDEDEEFGGFV